MHFFGLPNPTESMQNVHLFITLYQTNVKFSSIKPQVVFQNLHTTFNVMIFSWKKNITVHVFHFFSSTVCIFTFSSDLSDTLSKLADLEDLAKGTASEPLESLVRLSWRERGRGPPFVFPSLTSIRESTWNVCCKLAAESAQVLTADWSEFSSPPRLIRVSVVLSVDSVGIGSYMITDRRLVLNAVFCCSDNLTLFEVSINESSDWESMDRGVPPKPESEKL